MSRGEWSQLMRRFVRCCGKFSDAPMALASEIVRLRTGLRAVRGERPHDGGHPPAAAGTTWRSSSSSSRKLSIDSVNVAEPASTGILFASGRLLDHLASVVEQAGGEQVVTHGEPHPARLCGSASTPSNRRIPKPNSTGECAIVNSSIGPTRTRMPACPSAFPA